jgi:hypothetical protein
MWLLRCCEVRCSVYASVGRGGPRVCGRGAFGDLGHGPVPAPLPADSALSPCSQRHFLAEQGDARGGRFTIVQHRRSSGSNSARSHSSVIGAGSVAPSTWPSSGGYFCATSSSPTGRRGRERPRASGSAARGSSRSCAIDLRATGRSDPNDCKRHCLRCGRPSSVLVHAPAKSRCAGAPRRWNSRHPTSACSALAPAASTQRRSATASADRGEGHPGSPAGGLVRSAAGTACYRRPPGAVASFPDLPLA